MKKNSQNSKTERQRLFETQIPKFLGFEKIRKFLHFPHHRRVFEQS